MILDGRVEVDRQVVTELGTRIAPEAQEVRVDGVVLRQAKQAYFALNKPTGVLSTNRDPAGRERVIDLLPTDQRVFSVGRLDRSSEGLMLVTNDGDLAFRLTHPRYGVPKTYWVEVVGSPDPEHLRQLQEGVHLAEGVARVASLKVRRRRKAVTELEIVLNEGRNREIRRLLARIGHKVIRLKRVAIGPLRLGKMPAGAHRRLTVEEVEQLRQAVSRRAAESRRTGRGSASGKGSGRRKTSGAGAGAQMTGGQRGRSAGARGRTAQGKHAAQKTGKAPSLPGGASAPGKASRAKQSQSKQSRVKQSRSKQSRVKATGGKPSPGRPGGGKPAAGRKPSNSQSQGRRRGGSGGNGPRGKGR